MRRRESQINLNIFWTSSVIPSLLVVSMTLGTMATTSHDETAAMLTSQWKNVWIDIAPQSSGPFFFPRPTMLTSTLLDHLPIFLQLKSATSGSRRARRGLKFENMWALDKDCEEVIKTAWNEEDDASNVIAVERKMAACAKALSMWNSSSFGQGSFDAGCPLATAILGGETKLQHRQITRLGPGIRVCHTGIFRPGRLGGFQTTDWVPRSGGGRGGGGLQQVFKLVFPTSSSRGTVLKARPTAIPFAIPTPDKKISNNPSSSLHAMHRERSKDSSSVKSPLIDGISPIRLLLDKSSIRTYPVREFQETHGRATMDLSQNPVREFRERLTN
ncbi:LOW QUALITY PROTEIN: hypothetical protein Cgig2_008098 [Carnegiea gigantea]|uniref:Uncharacterized protein n=1 Tax=Carnegiea gigantea TaxID=171969 RepID=A0A9Q1L0R9_9CARY|nr:LOW QUALITY PROTEIN: hypothetical protein Cgig2_008098 [Carnegiea gigantea]